MIQVDHITKRYRRFVANDDISLRVGPCQLAMLVGPNGAGKSTLIKSICGLLRCEGRIYIGGHDHRSEAAKRILGYVPEMPALYPMLTVAEHLEFIARAYRLADWQPRADTLLERLELADKANKLGKELSKGMQQKVSVACALLTEPQAIILDEPLVGLDPHGIRELKLILTELRAAGCALLVSTHMIDTLADNWDLTHIMMGGRIVETVQRDQLLAETSLEDVYFTITEGHV
jgi:ABC-type multidrug transport system ATPase subunit